MSGSSVSKVREENVSILLSEILEEAGVTNLSLLNLGGVPDIYLLVRGVRIIVETKEEGHRAALQKQLEKRLEGNMCDLGVGLEYPAALVSGTLAAPTTKEVRKRLLQQKLKAIGLAHGATQHRTVFENIETRATELPELLSRVAGEALPDAEIESVIAKIREMIDNFAV